MIDLTIPAYFIYPEKKIVGAVTVMLSLPVELDEFTCTSKTFSNSSIITIRCSTEAIDSVVCW